MRAKLVWMALAIALIWGSALASSTRAGTTTITGGSGGHTVTNVQNLGVDITNQDESSSNYIIASHHVDGAYDVLTVTMPSGGSVKISVTAGAATDLKIVVIAPGGCSVTIENPGNVAYSASTVIAGGNGNNTVHVSGSGSGTVENAGNTDNTVTFSGAPNWTQRP